MTYRISSRGYRRIADAFVEANGFGNIVLVDYHAAKAAYEFERGGRCIYITGELGDRRVNLYPWMFIAPDGDDHPSP